MRCIGCMLGGAILLALMVSMGGCVSLERHREALAANRQLEAEKQQREEDLADARASTDALRMEAESCESRLRTAEELLASLRSENELLVESRDRMQAEMEGLATNLQLGDIQLGSPVLPQELDSSLKQFAQAHPDAIIYDPNRGVVKWTGDILFPLGSAVVRETALPALQEFTNIIKSPTAQGFEALVVGHTDNKPIKQSGTRERHPTNWHLSVHRAISVGDILMRNGYPPTKVGVVGYSEFRPVADNASEDGASRNRRVEIYLVPEGSLAGRTTERQTTRGS